jgi:hypothetical protein
VSLTEMVLDGMAVRFVESADRLMAGNDRQTCRNVEQAHLCRVTLPAL